MYSSSNILTKFSKNHYIRNKNVRYYRDVYLNSDHWKNLRKEKLSQFDFCEKCKSLNHLDVHHINYKGLYDVKLSDLKVFCRNCHEKEHLKKDKRKSKNWSNRNKKASDLKIPKPQKEQSEWRKHEKLLKLFNIFKHYNIHLFLWFLNKIKKLNNSEILVKKQLDREKIFNTYVSIHY